MVEDRWGMLVVNTIRRDRHLDREVGLEAMEIEERRYLVDGGIALHQLLV